MRFWLSFSVGITLVVILLSNTVKIYTMICTINNDRMKI